MQKYSLYAIVDSKAKCIVNTFTSVNNSTAERQFIDLLSDPRDNVFNLHASDFALYHVCDLSFDKGVISIIEPDISEEMFANGFTGNIIKTDEVVFEGSSLSSERLESLRLFRREFINKILNPKAEVSENG